MKSLAALPEPHVQEQPRVQLLVADDDPHVRSLVAARACGVADALDVLEAGDGAEAIQIALQQAPQLALLDVNMPRLGGIEVAVSLRELRPQMRFALYTADPFTHRERARECHLPLFDKLELDRVVRWLGLQARSFVGPRAQQKRSLLCSACGYGIARFAPPERCPMCQGEGTWIHAAWRPYTAEHEFA
jgi:CheY-like chemotaxis protein